MATSANLCLLKVRYEWLHCGSAAEVNNTPYALSTAINSHDGGEGLRGLGDWWKDAGVERSLLRRTACGHSERQNASPNLCSAPGCYHWLWSYSPVGGHRSCCHITTRTGALSESA